MAGRKAKKRTIRDADEESREPQRQQTRDTMAGDIGSAPESGRDDEREELNERHRKPLEDDE